MANQKIHEYPLERFVYGDDDYYDIDYWDGAEYKTAKILGSTIKAAMLSGIAISLTAPSAFIVGGSPTDGTGTLTLTAAGLANQYIRGDGTLATFPASSGGGNSVNYYLNGGTAASVATYYQMSKTAVIGTGVDFSLTGNGLISQWLTDLNDPNVTEIPAGAWNFEMFFSASSGGGLPKFYIEILKYDGTTFTTIANNSLSPEPITGGTTPDLYLTSVAVPLTPLLVTDRLAIRVYIVDSSTGRTITQHTQDSHLCQIITTFSSGVSSINGLTKQTQYLAVGTAGTDFNIDSATDTHTFNLPTASATKRGALSSLDWIAFNGKLSGLTIGTTPITSGVAGRVLFEGVGNVVQQDANFTFDSTLKRLTLKASGASGNDVPLLIRNSADNLDIVRFRANGDHVIGSDGGLSLNLNAKAGFSYTTLNLNGQGNTERAALRQTSNRLTFTHTNSDTVSSTLTTTGLAIGFGDIGATAKLDVRAQGALSTDIVLRVRNSTDTLDIIRANGDGNVFIGLGAGNVNTGANNTANGVNALFSNTTGTSNTANGLQALRSNTTGNNNTANGVFALYSNSTGSNNTANGGEALRFNTTGTSNTANGGNALFSNTTGGSNIASGFNALRFNTTGSNNTANGSSAGRFIADGVTANTITNNSIFIGSDTKANADNQTNQIVIGHNAIGAGSNTATIGNSSIVKTVLRGTINAANLPTSATGLVTGDIWNNGGVLNIV